MNEIAVVSEGVTDYAVLKNVLLGWFKGQPAEPFLKPYQPNPTAQGESAWQEFGGWENVLRYLRERKHRDALEYADYLVIQIDSDESQHPNYGVPQLENGRPLEPGEMAEKVAAHLRNIIGPDDCDFYGERIIFAICVREIECWLLPLWDKARAGKCEGCLKALNTALAKAGETVINPHGKTSRPYEAAFKKYQKQSVLLDKGRQNPSLALFLDELGRRNIQLQVE
jgi:hypothetical protein